MSTVEVAKPRRWGVLTWLLFMVLFPVAVTSTVYTISDLLHKEATQTQRALKSTELITSHQPLNPTPSSSQADDASAELQQQLDTAVADATQLAKRLAAAQTLAERRAAEIKRLKVQLGKTSSVPAASTATVPPVSTAEPAPSGTVAVAEQPALVTPVAQESVAVTPEPSVTPQPTS